MASDLGLRCLSVSILYDARGKWVKPYVIVVFPGYIVSPYYLFKKKKSVDIDSFAIFLCVILNWIVEHVGIIKKKKAFLLTYSLTDVSAINVKKIIIEKKEHTTD